jgi:hypothetical protein
MRDEGGGIDGRREGPLPLSAFISPPSSLIPSTGSESAPSREIGFDAAAVALVFEEPFSAGTSVETTEIGPDAGGAANSVVVGSGGSVATTLPEDVLLLPTVTVPGEPEPLSPAGVPEDEDDGGGEGVDGGGAGGIDLPEESSSPEDDPDVEEEPSVEPGEEPEGAELSSPSSLPPSSVLLAELEPLSSPESLPVEGGTVAGGVVADLVSEASSSSDELGGVEEEALLEASDDAPDVLSPSVELPLVFALSPEEASDPVSDDRALEEGLTLVPDDAVVGE